MNPYQCEEPIRCLFIESGIEAGEEAESCYELMWIQHEYCESLEETPVSYPVHTPVDTGIAAPWWMYWGLGFIAGVLLVLGVNFLIRGVKGR